MTSPGERNAAPGGRRERLSAIRGSAARTLRPFITVALEDKRLPRDGRTKASAATARDRLARTLRSVAQSAFSVELTARIDDLNLEVEGFGHVKFPVTPAKARKLLGLGQPHRVGRG